MSLCQAAGHSVPDVMNKVILIDSNHLQVERTWILRRERVQRCHCSDAGGGKPKRAEGAAASWVSAVSIGRMPRNPEMYRAHFFLMCGHQQCPWWRAADRVSEVLTAQADDSVCGAATPTSSVSHQRTVIEGIGRREPCYRQEYG